MNAGACRWCGDPLDPTSRVTRRTCSPRCRWHAWQAAHAAITPVADCEPAQGGAQASQAVGAVCPGVTCTECGTSLAGDRRTCSPACRQRRHRRLAAMTLGMVR